jgi:hypothetical protein
MFTIFKEDKMRKLFFAIVGLCALGQFNSFAAVENIKVSGDLTAYGVVRSDFTLGSHDPAVYLGKATAANDDVSVLASVANLRFEADLTEDILATITMTDERVWGLAADNVYASEAYVTIKNFLNSSMTIKVGKQPVHLYEDVIFGDFDGPTNFLATSGSAFDKGMIYDLSPRKNPEGIVAEYDFAAIAPLKLTGGYLKINEGGTSWTNAALNDDTNVYYADLAYMYKDIPIASLFYVGRHTQDKAIVNLVPNGKNNVDNYGARFVVSPMQDLILLVGAIYQYQNQTNLTPGDVRESAMGYLLCVQYTLSQVAWKPVLGFSFSFASDKWDIMYENASNASIMNAVVADTDGLVAGATLSFRPLEDLGVKIRYANARLYKANTMIYSNFANYAVTRYKEIGNEVDVSAVYDYTEDVQLGLEGGVFMPGRAFAKSNRETAKQAIGTLKVNF